MSNAQHFYDQLIPRLSNLDRRLTDIDLVLFSRAPYHTPLSDPTITRMLKNEVHSYTTSVHDISRTLPVDLDVVTYTGGFMDILTAVFQ
jgi:hypothetical protein